MDYYKILNISKDSDEKEIKQAWRKLSFVHHPDKNNNVESDLYKNINAAYETLSDETKKKKYDMEQSMPDFLKNGSFSTNMQSPFEFMNIDQDELFKIFFNNSPINMPFNFNGANRNNSQKRTRVSQTVTLNDLFDRKTFKIPIKINNSINDEVTFSVDGKVNDGDIIKTKSKNYNDVEIYIKLLHHSGFKKNGLNIIFEKKISLLDSLVGFSFKFNYLDNQEYTINNKIRIIYSGYIKTIKNMGLYSSGEKGNFIIQFDVEFPEILTDKQKSELKKILSEDKHEQIE